MKNKQTNPNSGSFVLEQLTRFGSDIDQKHEITYWLYFPTRKKSQSAADRVKATGLKADVSKSNDDSYLCLVHCPHIPDESLLDGMMEFCEKLANEFGGTFDGWESPLTTTGEDMDEILKELNLREK